MSGGDGARVGDADGESNLIPLHGKSPNDSDCFGSGIGDSHFLVIHVSIHVDASAGIRFGV